MIPIITNITDEVEADIKKIADKYFARWPYQENIIKDMINGVELDANHGYKKREVKNRTVIRKEEELRKNIRGLEQKIKPIEKGIEILKKEKEGLHKANI